MTGAATLSFNLTYCPIQYGQYNISVAASNTVGLGSVTYKSINLIPTGIRLIDLCIDQSPNDTSSSMEE